MSNKTLSGSLMVLAAAALWGTTGTAQSLAAPHLSAYWVGALRLVVATIFFTGVVGVQAQRSGPSALKATGLLPWPSVLLAGVCIASYNLAFFAGVKASGVAVGTAIALGSGPVWAGVLQWLITRAVPGAAWWGGTALAVAGGVLMVMGGMAGGEGSLAISLPGTLLCLLAGASYAAYAVINQRLVQAAPPAAVTLGVFGTAAVLAVPVALALAGRVSLTVADVVTVGYLGVVATGVAYLLFSYALRWVSSATAVTLALAEPLVAFVLAVVVLREAVTAQAVVGLGLVLAGLGVVVGAEWRRRV